MEKTFKSSDERSVGYGQGYVISSSVPDFIVGRLLTIMEALGLSEKQEKSLKDLIKNEVYSNLGEIWISGSLHNLIRDLDSWYRKERAPTVTDSDGNPTPNYFGGEYTLTYKE